MAMAVLLREWEAPLNSSQLSVLCLPTYWFLHRANVMDFHLCLGRASGSGNNLGHVCVINRERSGQSAEAAPFPCATDISAVEIQGPYAFSPLASSSIPHVQLIEKRQGPALAGPPLPPPCCFPQSLVTSYFCLKCRGGGPLSRCIHLASFEAEGFCLFCFCSEDKLLSGSHM